MTKSKRIIIVAVSLFLLVFAAFMTACTDADNTSDEKQVSAVEVAAKPTKTEYLLGETFTAEGGRIKVTYDDGTSEELPMTAEGVTIDEVNTSSIVAADGQNSETKTVTVRYGGKSVRFEITVSYEQFTVTFVYGYDGAENAEVKVNKDHAIGADIIEKYASPEREKYIFDGWYIDEQTTVAYDFDSKVTDNITLYAKWLEDAVYYEVTFEYNYYGCKPDKVTQKVKESDAAVRLAADPTRVGYDFKGWFTASEGGTAFDFDTLIMSDTTIYAQWEKSESYGGPRTYTFEAEDTDLSKKSGPSYSGTVNGTGMIYNKTGVGASGDRFVGYLYKAALSLDFYIVSDVAVDNVTLKASLSAEFRDFTLTPDNYKITVNGQELDFGSIVFSDVPVTDDPGTFACKNFETFTISTDVSLREGANLIKFMTANSEELSGTTIAAVAPLIDKIELTSSSVLFFDQNYAPSKPNY